LQRRETSSKWRKMAFVSYSLPFIIVLSCSFGDELVLDESRP